MKKFALSAMILLSTIPAFSDLAISDVLVRMKGEDVNLRVIVTNPGKATQQGPVKVTLFVHNGQGAWEQIQTWNDIANIKPGNKVARDYFKENNAKLRAAAKADGFEAKAVVEAPGVKPIEKIGHFNAEKSQ